MANLIETMESLQEEIAELTQANKNFEVLVETLKGEKEAALDTCNSMQNLIESLREDISGLEDEITDLETENDELQKDSDFLRKLRAAGVDNWEGYGEAFDDDEPDDEESRDWCSEEVRLMQDERDSKLLT